MLLRLWVVWFFITNYMCGARIVIIEAYMKKRTSKRQNAARMGDSVWLGKPGRQEKSDKNYRVKMSNIKVRALMGEVRRIRNECMGEEKAPEHKKNPDSFLANKEQLTFILAKLNDDVRERRSLQQKDLNIQKQSALRVDVHNGLEEVKQLLGVLDTILLKQKKKGSLSQEELQYRSDALRDLEALVDDVINLNTASNSKRPEANRLARDALASRKAARDARRNNVSTGGNSNSNGYMTPGASADNDIPLEPIAVSQQQQEWLNEVNQTDEVVSAKLDQIIAGTRRLKDLAEGINVEIQIENRMLDDLGTQITKTDKKFRLVNSQMKKFLDEKGGASRWCCIAILMVILVALLGASYNAFVSSE